VIASYSRSQSAASSGWWTTLSHRVTLAFSPARNPNVFKREPSFIFRAAEDESRINQNVGGLRDKSLEDDDDDDEEEESNREIEEIVLGVDSSLFAPSV